MGPLRTQLFKAEGSNDVGCVQVAFREGRVGVRDSRDHGTGPVLGFTAHQCKCFMEGAGNGESGLPG